jgi:hypothetical protein
MAIDIPSSLQDLAKSAVEKVFIKNLRITDLKPLYEWFENDGWDDLVMSVQGGCVYLEQVADHWFYDDLLKEDLDLDSGEVSITDEMRISFARMRLDFDLSQTDDSIHAVELKVPGLPSVFLDCLIKGQGQGGWEVEWGRAFKTLPELLNSYGDMVVMDSKTISDNKILKLWRANERKLKKRLYK